MSYFPNNIVSFQVPATSTLMKHSHSFPDDFHYPFESQHLHHLPPFTTDLHQFPSPEKSPEQVSPSTRRRRGRSASSKCQHILKPIKEYSTTDYIHVRARRGQATDSHSLAERVRREKISERMQTLQSLVPGCDKVTGKALKLDQIINYIQSLQTQVQYLSMKLASISSIYNDEMRQDQTNEVHKMNFKKHDNSPTQPIMDATTLTEHQPLENSNLLQHVECLFAQDGSDEVLPWDLDVQFLNQNVIDFDLYELTTKQ